MGSWALDDEKSTRSRPTPGLSEQLGRLAGTLVGPLFALGSRVRGARLFHPEGILFEAAVRPATARGPLAPLAQRLQGRALVRVSGGWWKGAREWPDLLGVAIRFGGDHLPAAAAKPTDQDLLFVTARNLKRIPFAFLTTNQHDFLSNHYYATSPFQVEGVGLVEFRVVPDPVRFSGSRRYRLERATSEHLAVFRLECRLMGHIAWLPLVDLHLQNRADISDQDVTFYPFNAGRGVIPRGFAHELRRATYPMSHRLRGSSEERPPAG
ncbi:MAG: hypothetical protein AB2A00_05225 [Myxococcota bacterium]